MASGLANFFLILLLVFPIVQIQSPAGQRATDHEKNAREDRDKKVLALVDQIIDGARLLNLPENRVRIDIALAETLWARDEKRARSLFNDAVAGFSEISSAADSGEWENSNLAQLPQQVRQEILQFAATRDPKLALDFLRASRPTNEQRSFAQPAFEAQLEMRLAVQIAAKDPHQALSIAEDSLKQGIDYESMNLLNTLQTSDKPTAERFLGDILNYLRTADFKKSPASWSIALMLLRTWIENNRPAQDRPAAQQNTSNVSLSNLDQQTARELSNLIINAALNDGQAGSAGGRLIIDGGLFRSYPGQGNALLQQLKPMLPDIERLSPDQISEVRKRLLELDKLNEAQQGPWAKVQEVVQKGTPGELIEMSKTAPPEIAQGLVQQAAWKALNQGDVTGAREIVEKIADPRQRMEMTLNLDRQAFYRASEERKLAEARVLLARLPSAGERANILCQLAAGFLGRGDKTTALRLLVEAQGLVADRALNYQQMGVQLQIARAYEQLDFSRTSALVGIAIDQLNELAAAASVLNGFDTAYFRNGEFINNAGNPLSNMVLEFSRELGSMAGTDLDLAISMAQRFQRPEMRLMALVQIAQRVFSTTAQ